MTTDTGAAPDAASTKLEGESAKADAAMARLQDALRRLTDGDLHRAHRGGGWTVAQVVSHMNVATILWLGDLERLRHDPDLRFFFREEIGHDALGYPPPTIDLALRQLDATRRTLVTCLPKVDPAIQDRSVEIPDLGTMTVAEWTPLIAGHLSGHVDQAFAIMTDREFLPEGI
jgi:DinB family protein